MRIVCSISCLALSLLITALPPPARAITYVQAIANINKMGMTLSNYGVMGTNFTSRAPSMEYPLGSGFQHLIHAGIWIGGKSYDGNGAFTGVSTASMDASPGQSPYSGDEFTPSSDSIYRRSSIPGNPYYTPGAVSEMDYISEFVDPSNAQTGNVEGHRSLGLRVTQYVYSWSVESYSHFLLVRYVIHNVGSGPLTDAWVGMYSELASGNMNAQTGSLYAGWFSKKWLAYEPDFRMIREHYCLNKPVPDNCHQEAVPYWAGVQLLTPPDAFAGQHVTLAAWPYTKGSVARDEDVERYAIMSAGTQVALVPMPDSLNVYTGDPVELLALGPFATIAAGDSIRVEFAFVGGSTPDSIRGHAYFAQRVRDMLQGGTAVAEHSSPLTVAFALHGVRPNPAETGAQTVSFALAEPGETRLECFDLLGRREGILDLGVLGPGEHVVPLASLGVLRPAVHVLRLKQAGHVASTRIVTLR